MVRSRSLLVCLAATFCLISLALAPPIIIGALDALPFAVDAKAFVALAALALAVVLVVIDRRASTPAEPVPPRRSPNTFSAFPRAA